MRKFCQLITLIFVIQIIITSELVSQPTIPGYTDPCPCSALFNGYYYTGNYYSTKPVLFSNMPLDQFVGYVIMDSIITHAKDSFPTWDVREDFIKSLTRTGDTLNYALKHLYRLADYNPFLYYNFLTSSQSGKMQPMAILPNFLDHVSEEYGQPIWGLMKADYILHLQVNEKKIVTLIGDHPWDVPRNVHRYTFTKVLDTIKGQSLPRPDGAIEVEKAYIILDSTLPPPSWENPTIPPYDSVHMSRSWIIPENTDFVYWNRNANKNDEVPNSECIVFSFIQGACINTKGYQYYLIRPVVLQVGKSNPPITVDGIFPIIDGNVSDSRNIFGWGNYVPVETFKQNLRTLIDSIKNYGE